MMGIVAHSMDAGQVGLLGDPLGQGRRTGETASTRNPLAFECGARQISPYK